MEHTDAILGLLAARDQALAALMELDDEVQRLVTQDADPVDLADLPVVLAFRDVLKATEERYEERQKAVATIVRDAIAANGLQKYEGPTHVAQIMYPPARTSIVKELLLLENVPLAKIQAATKTTPVEPFLRIDRRKEKAAE